MLYHMFLVSVLTHLIQELEACSRNPDSNFLLSAFPKLLLLVMHLFSASNMIEHTVKPGSSDDYTI